MIRFTRPAAARPVLRRGKAILLLGIGCPVCCLTSVASTAAAAAPADSGTAQSPAAAGIGAGTSIGVASVCAANAVAGRSISPGEMVNFDFLLTNTGAGSVCFEIADPIKIKVSGPAELLGAQWRAESAGAGGYAPLPAGGRITAPVAPGGSLSVRVAVRIADAAKIGQAARVALLAGAVTAAPIGGGGKRTAALGASEMALVQPASEASAAVYLAETGYLPGGAADSLAQDVLAYGLCVGVNTLSAGGAMGEASPGLAGETIQLDGAPATRILVSAAIPMLTTLAGEPVAPAGWQVVYSSTPLTLSAMNASWTTRRPPRSSAPLPLADASITRIGFVTDKAIAPGTLVTGFSFRVMTTGATAGKPITAISQLFGQTSGPGGVPVFDKAGDHIAPAEAAQLPVAPASQAAAGLALPLVPGTPPPDGVYYYTAPQLVENGPESQPDAVGPTGTDDDFTDVSAACPPELLPGAVFNPDPVTFVNTLKNPGQAEMDALRLAPEQPSSADELPAGVVVTIATHQGSAVYTYDGARFQGASVAAGALGPGRSVDYYVTVDLPAGTPQSVDIGRGFPVAVRAFASGSAAPDAGMENTTIDRVFTGCVQLTPQARLVDADGRTVIREYGSPLQTSELLAGRFIDYRIVYRNIADPVVGRGNVTIQPYGLTLSSSGLLSPGPVTVAPGRAGVCGTSDVAGSAADSGGGSISFRAGASGSSSADVSEYVDTINHALMPGESGAFRFRRRIN